MGQMVVSIRSNRGAKIFSKIFALFNLDLGRIIMCYSPRLNREKFNRETYWETDSSG